MLQRFSRNSCAKPFGYIQRVVGRRRREHDGEFLAPDPPDQVGLPQPGAQAMDDVLQGRIAQRMPVSIVDDLEVVNIDHQESETLPRPTLTTQRLLA